jgi:hypothetical protein
MGIQALDARPLDQQTADNCHESHGSDAAVFHDFKRFFPRPMLQHSVGRISQAIQMTVERCSISEA